MKLSVIPTPLRDAVTLEPVVHEDDRGFFYESWHEQAFASAGLPARFCQENHSQSRRGVIRGMHFQDMRAPLAKLVRCTAGRIFDVVVDLRAGSPSYCQWFGVELSAANRRQLFVPVGFAHGFQALEDESDVQYKQTGFYAPAAEMTIAWDDGQLAIRWPLDSPVLSAKDRQGQPLAAYLSDPVFRFDARAPVR